MLAQLQCTKKLGKLNFVQPFHNQLVQKLVAENIKKGGSSNVCAVLDAIDNSRSSSPIESFGLQDSHLWEDARPQENLDLKSDERTVEKECFVSSHLKNVSYATS